MTIDEAIHIEKTLQNAYGTNKSYHEQLAEWLEELKKRRSEDYGYMADIHQSIGYLKAIDDFVNACKENIFFGLHINGIEMIAEQLKAGGRE